MPNLMHMNFAMSYARGDNAMHWARANSTRVDDTLVSTLIAYALQAGSYVAGARANPNYINKWCAQLAGLIQFYVEPEDHVLEIGVGEATTLAGVIKTVNCSNLTAFGFDVSWPRIKVAQEWAADNSIDARVFVGDLFRTSLAIIRLMSFLPPIPWSQMAEGRQRLSPN
jgi:SAM-dependent methyltransferase